MNVLIVDDDKLARKGLVAIMDWEKYGFEVVGDVQNGRKALEFLRNHPVDIVFTDIDMPEIDGLELMQMCGEEFPLCTDGNPYGCVRLYLKDQFFPGRVWNDTGTGQCKVHADMQRWTCRRGKTGKS